MSVTQKVVPRGAVGDTVLLASPGHTSTSPDRCGVIVSVLGERGHENYLVRWPGSRLSVVSPEAVGLAAAQTPMPATGEGRS